MQIVYLGEVFPKNGDVDWEKGNKKEEHNMGTWDSIYLVLSGGPYRMCLTVICQWYIKGKHLSNYSHLSLVKCWLWDIKSPTLPAYAYISDKKVSTGTSYSGVRGTLGQNAKSTRYSQNEELWSYTCAKLVVISMAGAKNKCARRMWSKVSEGSDTLFLSSRRRIQKQSPYYK